MSLELGAPSRRQRGWLQLGWLLSRAAVLAVWLWVSPQASGDIVYYFTKIQDHLASGVPAAATMPEYPTPVLWVLSLLYLISGGSQVSFAVVFLIGMFALDLLFTVKLHRGAGVTAGWYWVGFGLVLGPIIYLRLDLLPALAVAGALIALASQRARTSGVLLGLGAGLKVWPALIYPITFSGQRRRDRIITVSFFATGIALVIAALLYGGWGRLVSPLQWQSGRGLQIESIWATVPMVARLFNPAYTVEYSRWQAFEVFGPGVDGWLATANLMSWLGYGVIALGYVAWARLAYPTIFSRHPRLAENPMPPKVELIALMTVTVITITLITNKTFSPQYFTWLGAAAAVFWLVTGAETALRRTARITGVWVLVLALATQVIYPLGYAFLLEAGSWTVPVTIVLVVRNLGVVVLGAWLVNRVIRHVMPARVAAGPLSA